MKKTLICLAVLCMALSLFCGAALAADAKITLAKPDSVQVEQIDKNGDMAFKITKSDAESGQLFLIMIQEGASASEKPKPTKDNLYYLNVEAAASSWEAYPKDLQQGASYVVYLSDYSDGNKGAAVGVATISLKSDSGDSGDTGSGGGGSTTEYQCGDVNHSGAVDNRDVRDLARYVGEWPDYMEGAAKAIDLTLADVNVSGAVDNRDVRDLARYVGEWPDYPSLPHTK